VEPKYNSGEKTNTRVLHQKIEEAAGSFEDLPPFRTENELWVDKIREILNRLGLSTESLVSLMHDAAGYSAATVGKWMEELPGGDKPGERRREYIICIGLVLGLELDELNSLIDRYARCRPLYMKNRKDAVLALYLKKEKRGINPGAWREYQNWCDASAVFIADEPGSLDPYDTQSAREIETGTVDDRMQQVSSLEELQSLFETQKAAFEKKNLRLLRYLDDWLAKTGQTVASVASGEFGPLNKQFSEIRNKGKLPNRDDMILFGVLAGMTKDDINNLLSSAGMDGLFAKNIAEAFLLYHLEYPRANQGEWLWDESRKLDAANRIRLDDTRIFSRLRLAYETKEHRIELSAATAAGPREVNQDSILADSLYTGHLRFIAISESLIPERDKISVFAVADGISAGSCGEDVSLLALNKLRSIIDGLNARQTILKKEKLFEIADDLNRVVTGYYVRRGFSGGFNGGTTIALAAIQNRDIWVMNVGDSPVCRIRSGELRTLSQEHTRAASRALRGEEITEADRHALTKYLGNTSPSSKLQADVWQGTISGGDVFVLYTDGVGSRIGADEIVSTVREGNPALALVNRALAAGTSDNASAIVLRFER